MAEQSEIIKVLSEDECYERLASQQLGRIVVRRADDMDIFPVNYVVDDRCVYLRSAEGNKVFTIALNHDVLFEVDVVDESTAWSVVVKGDAQLLTHSDEITHADSLPLKPWLPTLKYNYVKITPNTISGRSFILGEEPERY
ncbi:pyridoxamine 5'-phosphate oxidase family protein [Corynebacterium freiburgense]|uniref:pyridoxamine 5'-phosphate oxidase family protein n=1 Tax=Corynebacterium freiburgense TaxID=556548 RepID=UPI0004272C09|nr:pyridoxamine 5'-phosphate oxidase family protein [Corynebacterium freiburgense]WJZ03533.1 Pyridoxamine 5'-phosphate oxidase [Corynebacterium freiburgense]